MIVVLFGVAGCGKTTVGRLLAGKTGANFVDADALHPPKNIERMASGLALTDEDRRPWLERVRARMDEATQRSEKLVVACSALKKRYRDFLRKDFPGELVFVYLRGAPEEIGERLAKRTGHFMPTALLRSQFDALEEPAAGEAFAVDIDRSPEEIAAAIRKRLRL